jgi:hypothetical protein
MPETEEISEESDSDAELRETLYDQFDISLVGGLIIEYVLPVLDEGSETTRATKSMIGRKSSQRLLSVRPTDKNQSSRC